MKQQAVVNELYARCEMFEKYFNLAQNNLLRAIMEYQKMKNERCTQKTHIQLFTGGKNYTYN